MHGQESNKENTTDDVIADMIINQAPRKMADEKNVLVPDQDLFEADLYVWSLLLLDRTNI